MFWIYFLFAMYILPMVIFWYYFHLMYSKNGECEDEKISSLEAKFVFTPIINLVGYLAFFIQWPIKNQFDFDWSKFGRIRINLNKLFLIKK